MLRKTNKYPVTNTVLATLVAIATISGAAVPVYAYETELEIEENVLEEEASFSETITLEDAESESTIGGDAIEESDFEDDSEDTEDTANEETLDASFTQEIYTDDDAEFQISGRVTEPTDEDNTYDEIEAPAIPGDHKMPSGFTQETWEILNAVNSERRKVGLNPLAVCPELQKTAAIRAQEITTFFSHTRPNGKSFSTAYTIKHNGAGENIVTRASSASIAMNCWMNSKGHRQNILYPSYTHIGVGNVDREWTQDFAIINDDATSIAVIDKQRVIKKGKKLSSLGMYIQIQDKDLFSYVLLEDRMCSGYDTSVPGVYEVTVSFRGCETTFPLVVSKDGKALYVDDIGDEEASEKEISAEIAVGHKISIDYYLSEDDWYESIEEDATRKYKITYTSVNGAATINTKGKITAKKAGDIVVTTFVKEGYVYRAVAKSHIRIDKPKFTAKTVKIHISETVDLNEYMTDMGGLEISTWTISNKKVATLDPQTGVVTAVKKGSAKITAVFDIGGSKVKKTITVKVLK